MKSKLNIISLIVAISFLWVLFATGSAHSNPYWDKLKRNSKGGEKPSQMLYDLNPNILFQIKERGVETQNPVDDFVAFGKTCGLLDDPMGLRTYKASTRPLYFLLLLNEEGGFVEGARSFFVGDKYSRVDEVANHLGDGLVSQLYFSVGEKINAYFVKPGNAHFFVDMLLNASAISDKDLPRYKLEHDKGEKLFFIPNGEIPLVFITLYKKGEVVEEKTLEKVMVLWFLSSEIERSLLKFIDRNMETKDFDDFDISIVPWGDPDLNLGQAARDLKIRE